MDAKNRGSGLWQPDTDEDKKKDKEIAFAATTLLLAAFTIIVPPFLIGYVANIFHLTF
jgi:hypothetical protein